MIRAAYKLIRIIGSETEPGQISIGFAFALVAGFTPLLSLHNLFVLFLILVLRVNLSAFLLGLAFFSGIAYLLDPLFHRIGLAALTAGSLEGLWTALYNSTLWRLERFNNSIVMGSLIASVILFAPLYLLSNRLILKYREHFLAWVQKTKLIHVLNILRYGADA
jgi:uncharacterized protein (TIGR03546 family)